MASTVVPILSRGWRAAPAAASTTATRWGGRTSVAVVVDSASSSRSSVPARVIWRASSTTSIHPPSTTSSSSSSSSSTGSTTSLSSSSTNRTVPYRLSSSSSSRRHQQPQGLSFSSSVHLVSEHAEDHSEPPVSDESRSGLVSRADEQNEETKRKRLSEVLISEVLRAKHERRWVDPVISQDATLREAVVATIEGGLSGMMVLEPGTKKVVGLVTSRDLLRIMAAGIQEDESSEETFGRVVGEYMQPISQVIYGRPEETVGTARTIMAKLGIKCLPILTRQHVVEGLLTARDMSDYGLSAKERGGKESYLHDVSERVGLSANTSMADPPYYLKAHLAQEHKPLFVNVGVGALPHPFKTTNGLVQRIRDLEAMEYTSDTSLSEDAHFLTSVPLPDPQDKKIRDFTYLGVADGVGSWREYGVDPREFARRLMEESENICHEVATQGHVDGTTFRQLISPVQILVHAHERVKAANVVGSTTACIALFDGLRHQLHFSNLGDSGLIVLRHIDSDVAGSLKRERRIPRSERKSDLQVAFVSQQQLRSFNHPYQLGWTGDEESYREAISLKSARDSCTSSIHVRRGDIVILATDGLFDNVELDEISDVALAWEQKHGFIRGGDIKQRERRWAMGNSLTLQSAEHVQELAQELAVVARRNSLDHTKDSPFAMLAKDNDIMWSGGMPDDVTVLAIHIVGRDAKDLMDAPNM